MATTRADVRTDGPGYQAETLGDKVSGTHDESKWAPLTTEFWAMVAAIAGILIAAAVSDTFGDRRAWLYVTIVATGYIVSRGLAKSGTDHWPGSRNGRR